MKSWLLQRKVYSNVNNNVNLNLENFGIKMLKILLAISNDKLTFDDYIPITLVKILLKYSDNNIGSILWQICQDLYCNKHS